MSAPAVHQPPPPSNMALAGSPAPSNGRASPSLYHLDVRQQPRQARMAGSGEKADRRPIDPPPIIRLRTRRPSARTKPAHLLTDDDLATPTLTHTLFMFASLVEEDSEEEMFEVHGSKSALVAGSVVSSLFHLRDQSCFVFPDMSVRMEGRWRFKMSLYEVSEEGVEFRTSILTDVFQVYSSKRFPGMGKSTELSKSFAQQGLKLRIRRPGTKDDETEDAAAPAPKSAPKKRNSRRPSDEQSFAAPPAPRRPSAPVASTSQTVKLPPQRPWASWDAATGPSAVLSARQPQPAYQGRAVSYGAGVPLRPPVFEDPSAAYASAPSLSGPHRSVSGSYRAQAHPYGVPPPPPGPPPHAAYPYPHPHPHHRAHAFPHHSLPPSPHVFPPTHAPPPPPPPSHARAPQSHSPPPILPPIRHLAPPSTSSGPSNAASPGAASGTESSRSASAASTSGTSVSAHPHGHGQHGALGRRLSPPELHTTSASAPVSVRPHTQAAESSLRSTDAHDQGERPPAPARAGSSLAMLLGEGRDAKELEGGDGEVMFH